MVFVSAGGGHQTTASSGPGLGPAAVPALEIGAGSAERGQGGGVAAAACGEVAAEAEHVRPAAQLQPYQMPAATELPAGLHEPAQMLRDRQGGDLRLGVEPVVQAVPEVGAALGGVFGDVGGDRGRLL